LSSSSDLGHRPGQRDARTLTVRCLPVAGHENPYQSLMMEGLRSDARVSVEHGVDGKFFAAWRTAWAFRPDVIHYDWIQRFFMRRRPFWTLVHAPLFIAEIALVKRVFGCKVVWTLHNLGSHDTEPSRVEAWTRRRFANACDWVRVFQQSTVARARQLLGQKETRFKVVPEGSYVGHYPDGAQAEPSREALGLPRNSFVLLYLGNVRPYKGLEELVQAFEEVSEPGWHLVVAGRPYDEAYARTLIQRIEGLGGISCFLRFIRDEELQTFFSASDVVVLPFRAIENSGSAILAMGFGKPVLAPRLGALADRLSDQAELLYSPGHLTEALRSLKEADRADLERAGQRNLGAVERYNWSDFASAFEEFLDQR